MCRRTEECGVTEIDQIKTWTFEAEKHEINSNKIHNDSESMRAMLQPLSILSVILGW